MSKWSRGSDSSPDPALPRSPRSSDGRGPDGQEPGSPGLIQFAGRRPSADHEAARPPSSPAGRRGAMRTQTTVTNLARLVTFKSRKRRPIWVSACRKLGDNIYFIAFTTFLTVYALIGDDVRVLGTNRPADMWFNGFTLTCLVVFGMEIVLNTIGKNDYFMSFFFKLDCISTVTLLIDLTWVSEWMLGSGEEHMDKLRSGRTARLGAKAGRVVRVIRLVRILKLYKAIQEAKMKQRRRKEGTEIDHDFDDWGDDDEVSEEKKWNIPQESKVGKKLSEMTIRRVIILVLSMLLVLPFLRQETDSQVPTSATYGANEVFHSYEEWSQNFQAGDPRDQLRYEKSMLKYLYYHNWFTRNSDEGMEASAISTSSGSANYFSQVFWAGVMSSDGELLGHLMDGTQQPSPTLRTETVESWDANSSESSLLYGYFNMPSSARRIMAAPTWGSECNTTSGGSTIFRRGFSLLAETIPDSQLTYAVPCPENLRNTEWSKYTPQLMTADDYSEWHFAFYFDLRPFTRIEAMFGLCITVFICVVLCVASLMISNDANTLVLRPVENMVKRVEIIRANPLIAMKMADEEFKAEEKEKQRVGRMKTGPKETLERTLKRSLRLCFPASDDKGKAAKDEQPMETVVLEKTIIKLGSLLALGFGEAGANIIGHNMRADSAGVNAMISGERVECIIGDARIRDFSTATEVLQAKVMTFVNQIAEIVHGVVNEFHGAANKNNGDTFLLIWRTSGLEANMLSRMADMSMIAFAKCLGGIHRSPLLASYRGHPGLQQRLGTSCRVCLSFGLHSGWAIEGAVGSEFKIDASYLSPNVSIATSLEEATKFYNVPILVSQTVVDLCSTEIANKVRLIDNVMIRGSPQPMQIFSLDLDYWSLPVDDAREKPIAWNSRWRFKARQFLESEKSRKLDPEAPTSRMFEENKDIIMMRRRYTVEFLQLFNMGYQNYSEGEWKVARRLLTDTRTMLRVEDGPSAALLRFMETPHQFQAPDGWSGIRELHPSAARRN